jgi:group I intron endonuclease
MFYLYAIENTINGRMYIGKASEPNVRWNTHKCIAAHPEIYVKKTFSIHRAIAKYNDAMSYYVIQAFQTEDEAYQAETYWMEYLTDFGIKLYNIAPGGRSTRSGRPHTQETKNKISAAGKGRKQSTETIAKRSIKLIGNKSRTGQKQTPEEIEKRVSKLRGKKRPNAAMVGDKNPGKLYKGRTWTLINGKRVWADKGDLS